VERRRKPPLSGIEPAHRVGERRIAKIKIARAIHDVRKLQSH
jgi:hypothetical protein